MNEKLREALSLALQYVPAESKDPLEQEEIDKIHLLVKEGTEAIPIEPPVKPANGGQAKEYFINKYTIKRKGIDYGDGEIKYIQFRNDMNIFDPDKVWEEIISRLSV